MHPSAAPPTTVPYGRVFCIGRNYAEHVREMGDAPDRECVIFMKPWSSLVSPGQPLTLPRGCGAVEHELELVVALGRACPRDVPAEEALAYVGGLTLGFDLTLRDRQAELKRKGRPWELCKAFEQSAPLGALTPYAPPFAIEAVRMRCLVNGAVRQDASCAEMLFSVGELLAILSRTWRLLPGDLVYTGTPSGVGPLAPGDLLVAESAQLGTFSWRCE